MQIVIAGRDGPHPDLVEALGVEPARAVDALLRSRASAWAQAVGVTVADQAAVDADLPLILMLPVLAIWRPELADDALADLRAGCALAFAPIFDGGLYLLALAAGHPELRDVLADVDLTDTGAMATIFGQSERAGWDVGLLRAERGVRGAEDVRALRADPLTDAELRALLE